MSKQDKDFERKKKLVQEMNLMDDDFFQKVVEDEGACEEIIQTILQDENLRIIQSEPQKFLRNCGKRSVQLDLLCTSADNKYFNVEIQKSDNDDHQRRIRYNGSNLDTLITEKGIRFRDIPEVYIIYLANFDVFHGNCSVYHIDRVVRETGEVVDNGLHEIYANVGANDDAKIARLMRYMINTQGECSEFPKLSKRVKYFKEEQEGVEIMSKAMEEYARERAEKAAKKATRKAAREAKRVAETNARNLFINGASIELVTASIIGVTRERIQQIHDNVMREKLGKT